MISPSSTLKFNRLIGLDIIRFISIIAIVTFHANEIIFWQDVHPLSQSAFPLYRLILSVAQAFPYSGFTVIGISFFLLGLNNFKSFKKLVLFLTLGVLILAGAQGTPPFLNFYWEWDIYWYLLFSSVAVFVLSNFTRWHPWGVPIFFVMTWLPAWQVPLTDYHLLNIALIGICPPDGIGSWPLLPWIAWPCMFYCLGSVYRNHNLVREKLSTLQKNELIFWGVAIGITLPALSSMYGNPIGPTFYCHTLRQPPLVFWSHYLWTVFFLRLSLVSEINQKLAQNKITLKISNLFWSRKFGLSYLTHLLLLAAGAQAISLFVNMPVLFDIYFILLIPATEILVQITNKIIKSNFLKTLFRKV